MRYCSVECQRRHRSFHEDYCRNMGSLPCDKAPSTGAAIAKVNNDSIPEHSGSGHMSKIQAAATG